MTARNLPFFKNRLREVSKEIYLENGWQMPRGLMDSRAHDPRNFSLAEWQQAKRMGAHARDLKSAVQECWAVSDNRASFAKAMEERGLYLAKGDRRGHVAVTYEGEILSIPRMIGLKGKDVVARLGKPDELASVVETRQRIAESILPRLATYREEARAQAARELEPLDVRRKAMALGHRDERERLDAGQRARFDDEQRQRAERTRKGLMGLWDRLTGSHARAQKQNEMESFFAIQRDREQRHALITAQLQERQQLQAQIRQARARHAEQLRQLHHDAANYRLMQLGEEPNLEPRFTESAEDRHTVRKSPEDRLERLRTAKPPPDKGHEPEPER